MSVTSADFKSAASSSSATGLHASLPIVPHLSPVAKIPRPILQVAMQSCDPSQPLAGTLVVDLGRVLAAPFASSVLASLGARVIKVERPGNGDDSRAFGPFLEGRSLYFASVNCDKESIALDLKDAKDRQTFEQLISVADVLLENFSPGVMDGLGYGWEEMHSRWPRLIYGALSGFGRTGPMSQRACYDIIAQALSGMMSLTGNPGQDPVRVGASIGDLVAGLYLALAVTASIHKRTRTGEGCLIDISMLDCQVAFLEAAVTTFTATGVVPTARGTRHPSIAPFQAFSCADRWIVVAAGNDQLFGQLCRAIGRGDLAQAEQYKSNALRHAALDELDREISRTLATREASHWLALLDDAGVPAALVQSVAEMAAMEQVAARQMIVPIEGNDYGTTRVPGNPMKMTGVSPRTARRAPPELDEHREAILRQLGERSAAQA